MEHLLNGDFFSWLKEGAREMSNEQIEKMVCTFTCDLRNWSESVKDYSEVTRGLDGIRIRLLVWDDVYQTNDGIGKKEYGEFVYRCRGGACEDGGPIGEGTIGEPAMVYRASG